MSLIGIKREPRYLPWYPDWTVNAECAKYPIEYTDDLFFNYGRNKAKIQAAKSICNSCPVIKLCYRDNHEIPMGIFYGMTAIERWRERGLKGYPTRQNAYEYFAQFMRAPGMKNVRVTSW
jgi:hypothetical protein